MKLTQIVSAAIAFSLAANSASIAAQVTFAGTTTGQPTWNRPRDNDSSPPTQLSNFGTDVPYQSQPFFVDTSGFYDFTSIQNYDGVIFLYQDTFDPTTPLINVIIGNDSASSSANVSGFNDVFLTAITQYFFVTTGFGNNDAGNFTNAIAGPDATAPANITLGLVSAAAVPFEFSPTLGLFLLATWGAVDKMKKKNNSK